MWCCIWSVTCDEEVKDTDRPCGLCWLGMSGGRWRRGCRRRIDDGDGIATVNIWSILDVGTPWSLLWPRDFDGFL